MDQQMALYMASFTVTLVAGILVGYVLQRRRRINVTRASFVIIIVSIFSLGFKIGSNTDLLSALPRVGVNATVIALLAMGFSVVFVRLVRRVAGLK
jgi:ABC-type transport system involved in cytochrome c biogenesis permease subunit